MVKLPYAHQQKLCKHAGLKQTVHKFREAPVEIYETQIVKSKGTPPYHPSTEKSGLIFGGFWPPPSFRLQGGGSKMCHVTICHFFSDSKVSRKKCPNYKTPDSEKNYVVWLSPHTFVVLSNQFKNSSKVKMEIYHIL